MTEQFIDLIVALEALIANAKKTLALAISADAKKVEMGAALRGVPKKKAGRTRRA